MLTSEQLRSMERTDLIGLLENFHGKPTPELLAQACQLRSAAYGDRVIIRGLIEISSYCKNDCFYCGLRRSNQQAQRYRMTKEEIMATCFQGYELGFRTFVLQGGEDPYFTDQRLGSILKGIKEYFSDCAVTLSLGERSYNSYLYLHDAGADRYLLRHESANLEHYQRLHPPEMSLHRRQQCLQDLKSIGYQVGAGFMVGSPEQTLACLADDLLFLKALNPQMVGIGPFVPHTDTPFRDMPAGKLELTTLMLALTRLMLPQVLLPVTTALLSLHPDAGVAGLMAGGNVVMIRLTPDELRNNYRLYNRMIDQDTITDKMAIAAQMADKAGLQIDYSRGDYIADKLVC